MEVKIGDMGTGRYEDKAITTAVNGSTLEYRLVSRHKYCARDVGFSMSNVMDWSPKEIRGNLEKIVNDAEKDAKSRLSNNKALSRLISQEYADRYEPLVSHYAVCVGTEEEKKMLEKVLSKLEYEKKNHDSDTYLVATWLGTTIGFGTAAGSAVGVVYGWNAGFATGVIGAILSTVWTDKIIHYFNARLDRKRMHIGEKYGRIEIKV